MHLSSVASAPARAAVLSKAVVRAADRMGLSGQELATILGLSPATVSRMRAETYRLKEASKEFELALLLVRFFRSLDAITGGDKRATQTWMRAHNTALNDRPVRKIQSITGLTDGLAYLDSRRAPL